MKAEYEITRMGAAPSRSGRAAIALVLPLVLLAARPVLAQSDPTLDQVYQAAHAGHLEQAQQLMQPVLRRHPDSAKAREELRVAEQLAPGLPIARSAARGAPGLEQAPNRRGSIPWGVLFTIVGGGLAAWLLMRLGRPQGGSVAMAPAGGAFLPAGPNGGPQGFASTAPAPPLGLGQQVAGGRATGLAVGAGVMAAEAIGHRLFAHTDASIGTLAGAQRLPFDLQAGAAPVNPDLGGSGFGIDDASAWDDGHAPSGDWDR